MATNTKKPSAAPIAAVAPAAAKPAAKKAVATKTAATHKVIAPVAAPVTTPPVAAKKAPAVVMAAAAKPVAEKISATMTKLKPSTARAPVLNVEQRNHYVSVAAFYIAEQRGFTLGNPADDWLAAEAEVDRLIASGHFNA